MAISSAGIGSGLNVQSIVSQLVAVESQPVKLLQAKGATLQTKFSVFGQIKSELAALQDAASALVSATTWDSKTVTSSSAANVTGTAGFGALLGTFKVDTRTLATSQTLKISAYSPTIDPSTNPLPDGSLTFQLGSWNGTTFTKKQDTSVTPAVDVASVNVEVKSTDTLTTLANRINSSNAGVNAVVVTNGTSQQLVLRGSATGSSNGFSVSTPTAGLEKFQYDNAGNGPGIVATAAANADLSIEGIPVSSQSNTVDGAVPGITLNLLSENSSADIKVATDKDAIKAKIQAFQDAYNKLNTDLKTQTKYDAASKTGGPLLGDSSVSALQNMLRTLVGASGPSSTAGTQLRLSDIGLEIQADGALKTNTTKLDNALQDTANLKAFFATNSGTASQNGIAKRIYDFAFAANGVGGQSALTAWAFRSR